VAGVPARIECGIADLKMSDYGITPDEIDTLAKNARETMGGFLQQIHTK
jgi:hypothetical protein